MRKPRKPEDLEDALKSRNPEYYENYLKIKESREADYATISTKDDQFDTHGPSHLNRIQKKLDGLLGPDGIEGLNSAELYALLCAIRLHDISMAITKERKNHPEKSAELIEESTNYRWIDDDIKYVVGNIIRSHGKDDLEAFLREEYPTGCSSNFDQDVIRVGPLMALLRIGDIMDWAYDRAPESVREGAPVIGNSFYYWFRHSPIKEIAPRRASREIYIKGQHFNYFTCKILSEELAMLNRELDSNRQQLSEIGINFKRFSFNKETKKQMERFLRPKAEWSAFRPFISYEQSEYLMLQGRNEDEDGLIQQILDAREHHAVPVLTAESGSGKTSLLKARIFECFQEMGFNVNYFDNVSEALSRLETIRESGGTGNNGAKTTRYLVILDQLERSFPREKELGDFFRLVKELCEEEDYHNRIVYFCFSVPSSFWSQLLPKLSAVSLEPRPYYLKPLDPSAVVTAILNQKNIPYEKAIVDGIINHLLSTENADITNVHILFETLLKTDEHLLSSQARIQEKYGSVDSMADTLMKTYFEDKFSQLTGEEKALLEQACSNNGRGTRRVPATKEVSAQLERLAGERFIRLYMETDTWEYEFVHDILARKFYEDVLGEHAKEIHALAAKIQSGSLDRDSLLAIHNNRSEIVKCKLGDTDIAYLVLSYMPYDRDEELSDDADWWAQKYQEPGAFISALTERVEKSAKYKKASLITKAMPPVLDYAEQRDDRTEMTAKLKEIAQTLQYPYRTRCVAVLLLENWGYPLEAEESVISVAFAADYQKALVEPAYSGLYLEVYYYLLHNNLVDKLIQSRQLSSAQFQHILNIFAEPEKEARFYSSEHQEDPIDPRKFESIVSLLTPTVIERLKTSGSGSMKLLSGKITHDLKGFSFKSDSTTTVLTTAGEPGSLLRFSYRETVAVAFLSSAGKAGMVPLAFLKKESEDSQRIFTAADITKVIWQYKVRFANHYSQEEFDERIPITLPEQTDSRDVWSRAREDLDKAFQSPRPNTLENFVPDEIHGTKLSMLYASLCYLNYLNLQPHSQPRFHYGKIILMQTDDTLNGSELYNRFYIELKEAREDAPVKRFDPYMISGYSNTSHTTAIEFQLITEEKEIAVTGCTIKRELEFCDNGSAAVAIGIGSETAALLKKYSDSFSFQIKWDDKVNRVSQAIDAWEYELNKVLVVLKENKYITDLFVFGDTKKCSKTVKILSYHCKVCKTWESQGKWILLKEPKVDVDTQFFQSADLTVLENVNLHIIPFETDIPPAGLDAAVSAYFLCNYNTAISLNIDHTERGPSPDALKEKCREYLESIDCYSIAEHHAIRVERIDDAYKAMLAALICFGNKQVDSAGTDILDLRGFSLVVKGVSQDGFRLSYRRADIDEYYENQWDAPDGVIKKIADTTNIFSVNQVETIIEKLKGTINKHIGCRKLTISFYNPTNDSISNFTTPSLLNCFLIPRYEEEQCFLDVIFVWRTNECVLGLPMSLEASIRWIVERILSEFDGRIKIGNYTYFGLSMHCANNFIMRQMIMNIIQG